MFYRVLFFAFLATTFFGCTKEQNAPKRSMYYDYYPLKEGFVWIYDVDSTFYNNFNNSRTDYVFNLKDTVTGYYINLSGDTVYRVERYKRESGSDVWNYQKTITKSVNNRSAEETIDNQTFVRFAFPPELYYSWDGNSRNTLGKQNYRITEFPTSLQVGDFHYDSVAVVQQIDEVNLIREDIVSEVYAKNKGLIKKSFIGVDKNISSGQITHGTVYTMELKDGPLTAVK